MNGMVEEVKGSKMDQKETYYIWLFSSDLVSVINRFC